MCAKNCEAEINSELLGLVQDGETADFNAGPSVESLLSEAELKEVSDAFEKVAVYFDPHIALTKSEYAAHMATVKFMKLYVAAVVRKLEAKLTSSIDDLGQQSNRKGGAAR